MKRIQLRIILCLLASGIITSENIVAQKNISNWTMIMDEELTGGQADIFSNQNYFQLDENTKMVKYKEYVDELGFKHERYIQSYKNIRVEEGHYILHYSNGALSNMNGSTVSDINLDFTLVINEDVAITSVITKFNQQYGAIENYEVKKPSGYIALEKDKDLKGSLVITSSIVGKNKDKDFFIAYKFNLILPDNHQSYTCYVNAISGEVIKIISNSMSCNIGTATGDTRYNGSQSFKTEWTGSIGKYKLYDDCRKIYTYDIDGAAYKDADNSWTDTDDREGVSAHWALQRTFDFYEYAYNLTGVDGFYQQIDVVADWDDATVGARWDEGLNRIYVSGEGNTSVNSFATLDILGHEWTHAVDEYSSSLIYENESGALDESFADIFGTMVEYSVEGMNAGTYLMGSDRGTPTRSLISPWTYGDPSIYEGTNWFSLSGCTPSLGNDFCGVHTNSGVQNHWFYLLAEGGSQTVGSTTYTVTGIGIENAAYVAYKNRRDYLSSNSDYADSKNGSIFAAIDIWGECDWKVEQVINAWNAVGVSSTTGVNYGGAVGCGGVSFFHGLGLPFKLKVLNNLTSNCTYPAGKISRLDAGNEIVLQPGSVINGDFRARIIDCLDNNMRTGSPYPTNYAGIGNAEVEISDISLIDNVSIYPNPSATGKFNIELPENAVGTHIEVLNLMGALIYTSQVTQETKITFDINEQPKGIYLVRLSNGNKSFSKKIIYN